MALLPALPSDCTVNPATADQLGTLQGGLCTSKASIFIPVNYGAIAPLLILGGGVLLVLVLAATLPKGRAPHLWPALTAAVGLGTVTDGFVQWSQISSGMAANQAAQQQQQQPFHTIVVGGQIFYDHYSAFFVVLFGAATVLGAGITESYMRREGLLGPEPYVLMLSCSLGAVLMAEAAGLISLFLGLEVMSIALYVMTAYHKRRSASGEAGLKYFILGSFASALFIYGVALVYGATGAINYFQIIVFLYYNTLVHNGVLLAGMGLIIVGLGFKVAAVPFHFWSPDVYQGAPTPFAGYMAAVAKAGGFAGLVRVLMLAFPVERSDWRPIIWAMAVLSVIFGSLMALAQADIKRLLAYSSISQAGYVLIGLQPGTSGGVTAVCFYLFTYTFMVIGTFAIVGIVQGRGEARNDLSSMRGLAYRSKWLAGAMLVLLLGQAGIPLTSGFLGKWVVIAAAVAKGQYALGIIGMLGAAIAAFFYLRVALLMFMPADAQAQAPAVAPEPVPVPAMAYAGASDLPSIASAGLAGRDTLVVLRAPSAARLRVPFSAGAVIAVCVAFTIFAGVSTPVLSWAHSIQLLW
ncbi:MAG TPA: NADH-quinone oxidoreductase subunit N [Acidimicrobiales bacterium]|nr:NADH-quinone oxidoreductase subunit N [Acidimicrobiales bacterium]